MKLLAPDSTATLKDWFLPEQPGPLIGPHVIRTGNGACFVDRWPNPRMVLAATGGNYTLLGDAHAVQFAELGPHIRGFVNTSEELEPVLMAALPDTKPWARIILEHTSLPEPQPSGEYVLRRLGPQDAHHLWGLSPGVSWISATWGGPPGLAASGYAWGAFVDGRLASVACTFYLGERYEEIGIVTEPDFRRQGLSTACAHALCSEVLARGHAPSWTTSPDNVGSLRVAEKVGFAEHRRDVLYAVGVPIPEPA